jgi:tellurite resistance protein
MASPTSPAGSALPAGPAPAAPAAPAAVGRLAFFPISFFSMVMGLAGLTIALEKAQHVFELDLPLGLPLAAATAAVFVVLLVLYAAKAVRHRSAVAAELNHPVKVAFFPTISISLLLLAIAILGADGGPVATEVARGAWLTGTVLHLVMTLYVIGVWMHQEHFRIQHMNPAWFIPAVGNVVVPVAGVPLGYVEVSWFFFSAGIMLWIVLLTIVMYRMFFHEPIEARLLPSLFILIAPPAVGFIAWTRFGGELDGPGRVLYFFGLFVTLLVFSQAARFARLPFGLPSWAYSFPLAAITIATYVMFELTGVEAYRWLATGLLAILVAVVAVLVAKTTEAIARGRICVPGH